MEVILRGRLLDCDFEKWRFEDKTGIRYYCTVKDSNKKIVQFKINEDQYPVYLEKIGEDIEVRCNVFINGNYSLKLIEEEE